MKPTKAKSESPVVKKPTLADLRAKAVPASKRLTQVNIIESERGWGQKVDETLYFEERADAQAYVDLYNKTHNPPRATVPDWYMIAQIV